MSKIGMEKAFFLKYDINIKVEIIKEFKIFNF